MHQQGMYCPSCRAEYRPDIPSCAHCEVDLVAELPPEDPFSTPDKMAQMVEGKELQRLLVGDHVRLREAQRILADNRVASVLAGEDDEIEPGMHSRFYLLVTAEDVDRSQQLFRDQWSEGLQSEGLTPVTDLSSEAGASEQMPCPACGAAVAAEQEECPDCGLFVGSTVAEEDP